MEIPPNNIADPENEEFVPSAIFIFLTDAEWPKVL